MSLPTAAKASSVVDHGRKGAGNKRQHSNAAFQQNTSKVSDRETQDAAESSFSRGFLFSPLIDLLFIANVLWPLVLLIDWLGDATTHESFSFWQIYFVTTPHRWITLILVSFDETKTANRKGLLVGMALVILVACLCVRFGTGTLLCIGVIDYIWNAWHFASQHHGIFRIYQRKGSGPQAAAPSVWNKIALRGFLLYVIARVAGWGWPNGPFAGSEAFAPLDWIALLIPIALIGNHLIGIRNQSASAWSSTIYLMSVLGLFTSMLLAAHWQDNQMVLLLALASAIFHSLEYLSIVTWSVQRDRNPSNSKIFRYLSRIWLLFLALFIVIIGAGNYLMSRGYFEMWVLINIIVAFWHYGFDGLIWKSPNKSASSNHVPAVEA